MGHSRTHIPTDSNSYFLHLSVLANAVDANMARHYAFDRRANVLLCGVVAKVPTREREMTQPDSGGYSRSARNPQNRRYEEHHFIRMCGCRQPLCVMHDYSPVDGDWANRKGLEYLLRPSWPHDQ
jgi:hypothetical protein